MKTKTTNKKIYSTHMNVLKVGFCRLQHLLNFRDPDFYNYGIDGWKYDAYSIGSTAIVTGYQPIGEPVSYDLAKKYDDLAIRILADNTLDYQDKRTQLDNLIYEFIEKATNQA